MGYRVFYTEDARRDLKSLDLFIAQRIIRKVVFFVSSGEPLKYAVSLKDHRLGMYRFRVGVYRVIFDIDQNGSICILMILRIKHRKDVYGI